MIFRAPFGRGVAVVAALVGCGVGLGLVSHGLGAGWMIVVGGALVALGVLAGWRMWRARFEIRSDRVLMYGVFRDREVERRDVVGVGVGTHPVWSVPVLEVITASGGRVPVPAVTPRAAALAGSVNRFEEVVASIAAELGVDGPVPAGELRQGVSVRATVVLVGWVVGVAALVGALDAGWEWLAIGVAVGVGNWLQSGLRRG